MPGLSTAPAHAVSLLRRGVGGGADDAGGDEDDQLRLHQVLLFGAEEIADERDVAQQRDLAVGRLLLVQRQAADGDGLAVLVSIPAWFY